MIVASMTSWRGRIATAGRAIYWICTKQTIKPDVFVLTLSEDEFPNKEKDLPEDLLLNIAAFNIELNWVKRNIYAHKKYEVFKKCSSSYIFLFDDDILYPSDHIESLLKLSKQNNDKYICCYYTVTANYIRKKLWHISTGFDKPSLRNLLLSGLACFPPNILNLDVFKYENQRDRFCQLCDDSWIKAWSIKCKVPIIGYKKWNGGQTLTTISDTQQLSIWANFNSKRVHGVNQKVLNFINAISVFHIEKEITEIWPNFY